MHRRRHLTLALALLLGVHADPPAVEEREREDRGHHEHRNTRQQRVDERHHDDHHQKQDRAGSEADDRVDEDVAQQDDVRAQPHERVAGLVPLMERERQAMEVAVKPRSDRVHDLLCRPREQEVLVVVSEGPHEADQPKRESGRRQDCVRRAAEDREDRSDPGGGLAE